MTVHFRILLSQILAKIRTCISGLVLVLIVLLLVCQPALSENAGVDVEVCCLGQKPSDSQAMAIINFKNNTSHKVIIPFSEQYGKGGNEVVTRDFKNLTRRETEFHIGGEFCRFEYRWHSVFREDITGLYESNHEPLTLLPKSTDALRIPIKCPSEPGVYDLTVKFDNRNLQSVLSYYNQKPDLRDVAFFTASSSSKFKITIPNKPFEF